MVQSVDKNGWRGGAMSDSGGGGGGGDGLY